jgi:uncharacterized protein (TIGR02145 family)
MRIMRSVQLVVLISPFIFMTACSEKENVTPTCEIVFPRDGEIIMQGDQVSVVVKADDEDGSITKILLYIDGEVMEETETSTIEYTWNTTETEVGSHVVSAVASDDQEKVVAVNHIVLVSTRGGFNPDLSYGTMSDIDGNTYGTIEIGDQVWMAENLKASRYADGTAIPLLEGEAEWDALSYDAMAYCWYENQIAYADTCGALYTWAAAMNGIDGSDMVPSGIQGVCPDGWHMPADAEWEKLEIFLGMSQETAESYDWRGTDEGVQLKETGFSNWEGALKGGSNSSGFTAIPGGFRTASGLYFSLGQYATFWTATADSENMKAWYRSLHFEYYRVYRQYNHMNQGFSVRCVAD